MTKFYRTRVEASSKPKSRTGVAPDPAQQPLTFGRLFDAADGTAWNLTWVRYNIGAPGKRLSVPQPMKGDGDWMNCKLHADGRASHKANFWLSLNVGQGRMSARWDAKALMEHRPRLADAITHLLHWLRSHEEVELEFSAPMLEVRPKGEGWVVTDTTERGKYRALRAEFDELPVGGQRTYVLADLPYLKEVKKMMHPKTFTGEADPVTGGILVTRTA